MPTEEELFSAVDALLEHVAQDNLPAPPERKRLREASGLSQAEVAHALGTRRETVANWEAGKREPRPPHRAAYTRLLEALAERFPAPAATPTPADTPAATPQPTTTAAQALAAPRAGDRGDHHSAHRPAPPTVNGGRPTPRRVPAPAGYLPDLVRARVADELAAAGGDVDTARNALIKTAITDVMALFAASRVGGRYEHSEFPPTEDILRKSSQKGADQIWEARPKWRSRELHEAARAGHVHLDVTVLDANAAYLAAMKTHLPIGKLVHSTSGRHDPKRSGVHRITPPEWTQTDLPSPLGDRRETGPVWIAEPTLRVLHRAAKLNLCEAPTIHESWTSGSSEALLEKMRRALAENRSEAIERDDEVTIEYVKSMYSKFVSTIGESSANRALRRPDWMHIIRSQAFANLWYKALKAHQAGLTVVQMSGTDELHIAGDWHAVFRAGRGLAEMKPKETYTLGSDQ